MQIRAIQKFRNSLGLINKNYGPESVILTKLIEKFLPFIEHKVPYRLNNSQLQVHNHYLRNTILHTSVFPSYLRLNVTRIFVSLLKLCTIPYLIVQRRQGQF
jgi:hypothetical protein